MTEVQKRHPMSSSRIQRGNSVDMGRVQVLLEGGILHSTNHFHLDDPQPEPRQQMPLQGSLQLPSLKGRMRTGNRTSPSCNQFASTSRAQLATRMLERPPRSRKRKAYVEGDSGFQRNCTIPCRHCNCAWFELRLFGHCVPISASTLKTGVTNGSSSLCPLETFILHTKQACAHTKRSSGAPSFRCSHQIWGPSLSA